MSDKIKMHKIIYIGGEGAIAKTNTKAFRTSEAWLHFWSVFRSSIEPGGGYWKSDLIILWEDGRWMEHRLDFVYKDQSSPIEQLQGDLRQIINFPETDRFDLCDQITKYSYKRLASFLAERDLMLM